MQKSVIAYVGCFTTPERCGRGKGICVFRIDPDGTWTLLQETPVFNPGYLALRSDHRVLYVSHGDGTRVSAWNADEKTGLLVAMGDLPSGGMNGAHICLSKQENHAFVAHFSNGIVSAIRLENGMPSKVTDLYAPQGENGPLRAQFASQPHFICQTKDGKFLYICDRGKDAVYVLGWDDASEQFRHMQKLSVVPALGPRHMAIHPTERFAYILTEFIGDIVSCRLDANSGRLEAFQRISALPDSFVGADNTASEIAIRPDGKFLYVSNRGHDSLGVYRIEEETGRLSAVQHIDCGGAVPRFFCIDPSGRKLLCANEQGDNICIFDINEANGRLTGPTSIIETPTPSCIVLTGAYPVA